MSDKVFRRSVNRFAPNAALAVCFLILQPLCQCVFQSCALLAETQPTGSTDLATGPQNASDCDSRLADLGMLAARPETEISQFQSLTQACPRSPEAFYALGVAFRKQGKLSDARREFTRALELRDSGTYRIALGVVNLELGNVDEAAQIFAKAAELDPHSTAALQGRATVAASQGDVAGGIAFLQRAIAIDNDNPGLFFNLAVLLERSKKYKEAASDYSRVTVLDSAQIAAWCRLGMIRYALGETDSAVAALTQCVDRGGASEASLKSPSSSDLNKQVAEAGIFLARALGETGESERAELTLRRMIEKSPTDVGLKVSLAEIYTSMKRFDEALSQARAATLIGSSDPRAWAALGSAALGIGDTAEAQAALLRAKSLSAGNSDAALINNLGVIEMRLGHSKEAKGLFEEALKIDQQFEPAKNNLQNLK